MKLVLISVFQSELYHVLCEIPQEQQEVQNWY